jgi:hypothetical protein
MICLTLAIETLIYTDSRSLLHYLHGIRVRGGTLARLLVSPSTIPNTLAVTYRS